MSACKGRESFEAVRLHVEAAKMLVEALRVLVEALVNKETVRLFVKSMRGQRKSCKSVENVGFFAGAVRECLYCTGFKSSFRGVRVFVESMRGQIQAVTVLLDAMRVLVEAVRLLVEAWSVLVEAVRERVVILFSYFDCSIKLNFFAEIRSVPNIRNGLFQDIRKSAEEALFPRNNENPFESFPRKRNFDCNHIHNCFMNRVNLG